MDLSEKLTLIADSLPDDQRSAIIDISCSIMDLEKTVSNHESIIHHHFCNGVDDRLKNVLAWYQREAADQITIRKELIESSISYFRSVRMLCESVGMGTTHAEKEHRLRGLIQLLDIAIEKLRAEETENLESNWPFFRWGNRSDYPYRDILRKFDELKRENEELKKKTQNGK